MGFKVCIFDFDGTLVESMDSLAQLAAFLLAKWTSLSYFEAKEQYLKTSGIPFLLQLESIVPDYPHKNRLAQAFEMRKKALFQNKKLSQNTQKVLKELKREFFLAISSGNDLELIKSFLGYEGLSYFDQIKGYDPECAKGAGHFEYFMKTFNVARHELVFIGDSLKDAQLSCEFGVPFIAKLGTFGIQDFLDVPVINNLEELILKEGVIASL